MRQERLVKLIFKLHTTFFNWFATLKAEASYFERATLSRQSKVLFNYSDLGQKYDITKVAIKRLSRSYKARS